MLTSFLESILWCCFGSKFFDILLKSIVLVLFFVLESSVNPCRKQALNEFESLLESTFYSCLKSFYNFVFVVLELCFCCFVIMFLLFLTSFLESSHRSHSSLCCFCCFVVKFWFLFWVNFLSCCFWCFVPICGQVLIPFLSQLFIMLFLVFCREVLDCFFWTTFWCQLFDFFWSQLVDCCLESTCEAVKKLTPNSSQKSSQNSSQKQQSLCCFCC